MISRSVISTAGPEVGSTAMTGSSDEGPMASVSARGRVVGRAVVTGDDDVGREAVVSANSGWVSASGENMA